MQVPLEDPGERLLELLIGERVTKGVHGRVRVAEKVREHEPVVVGALAETLNQRQHMVRRPAEHETAQNERDGPERLSRPILRL